VQQTLRLVVGPRPSGVEPLASHREWRMGGAASMAGPAQALAPLRASSASGGLTGSMVFGLQRQSVSGRKAQRYAARSNGWLNWRKHYDGGTVTGLLDVIMAIAAGCLPDPVRRRFAITPNSSLNFVGASGPGTLHLLAEATGGGNRTCFCEPPNRGGSR
jgi:hypothetical protein